MLVLGMMIKGHVITAISQRFILDRPVGAVILGRKLDVGLVVAEISQAEVMSTEPARNWTASRHWELASDAVYLEEVGEAFEYYLMASGLGIGRDPLRARKSAGPSAQTLNHASRGEHAGVDLAPSGGFGVPTVLAQLRDAASKQDLDLVERILNACAREIDTALHEAEMREGSR